MKFKNPFKKKVKENFIGKYFINYTFDGQINRLVHVEYRDTIKNYYWVFIWDFIHGKISYTGASMMHKDRLRNEDAVAKGDTLKREFWYPIECEKLIKDDFTRSLLFTPVQIAQFRIENST